MVAPVGFFTGSATGQERSEKPEIKGLKLSTWRITRIEVPTKEYKAKNPEYLGSIFVEKSNAELGETGTRMWLRITTATKFSVNAKIEGATIEDLAEGMTVSFQFSGSTNSLPPKAFATELGAVGAMDKSIAAKKLLDLLKKRP